MSVPERGLLTTIDRNQAEAIARVTYSKANPIEEPGQLCEDLRKLDSGFSWDTEAEIIAKVKALVEEPPVVILNNDETKCVCMIAPGSVIFMYESSVTQGLERA